MSNTKNLFAALSEETTPKQASGQPKKKNKKKGTPLNLHAPPVPVVEYAAPRHPLRTEMTEEEEFRAALEASKKEAEKAKSTQQQQWSSVAKPVSSTPTVVTSQVHTNGSTPTKSKALAATQAAPAKAPSSNVVPSRPAVNPWATKPSIPAKPTEPSPAPPVESSPATPPPIQEIGRGPSPLQEDLIGNDDELFVVPIVANASRAPASSVRPISRPVADDSVSLDIQSKLVASVLEDDIDIPLKNGNAQSLAALDVEDDLPITPSGYSSSTASTTSSIFTTDTDAHSLSSYPATLSTTTATAASHHNNANLVMIPAQTLQQLQESLQAALTRISTLEQANDLLFSRVSQIVDASMHLERFVNLNTAENNIIKTQIQELRNSFYLGSSHSDGSSSSAFQPPQGMPQGGYSQFVPMPSIPSQPTQRPPSIQSTPGSTPLSMSLNSLGFSQSAISQTPSPPLNGSNSGLNEQQGLGGAFFGRNGPFM